MRITTRYLTGDRWGSNVGGIRATGAGRQRTRRWDAALSTEQNHRAAAVSLGTALGWGDLLPVPVQLPDGVTFGEIRVPLEGTPTDDPGVYRWDLVTPWDSDKAQEYADMSRQNMRDHGHGWAFPSADERDMVRENCGACALAGYGEHTDGDTVSLAPNYAGWARIYVESGTPVPRRYVDGFVSELRQDFPSGYRNARYADALRRSVLTFGLRLAGGAS